MNTAILLFVACTFANVILSTIKSVMTIKGGKLNAAIWNALSFGLYSYLVILTASAPISTIGKIVVTVGCNLVGVYCVKLVEENLRKDRMWKIEQTVAKEVADEMHNELSSLGVSNNYTIAGKHAIFNCYCENKEQSNKALKTGKCYNAKAFATETKLAP